MPEPPESSPLHPPSGRRLPARDAVIVVLLAVLLLVLFEGPSIRHAGQDQQPGAERDVLRAVGAPAGWVADRLPFDEASDDALAFLEDDQGGGAGAFGRAGAAGAGVPAVPSSSFDPAQLGEAAPAKRPLGKLLVTGDSLSMPLDAELARRLVGEGVDVDRDPHVGTGLSKEGLADWGELAARQTRRDAPDAVVMFVGANEGFDLPGAGGPIRCCGADWAAAWAFRARSMIETYRQGGRARVYWLTVPAPRDSGRARISRAVNAAIGVAAEPYRAQARVLDMAALFTPGFRYRDAMDVGGRRALVREPDGIHLNARGAAVAADAVVDALRRDFEVR